MSDLVSYDLSGGSDIPADDVPYRCEVCGVALEYSGRGRPPVRCTEHKKGKASSSSGRQSVSKQRIQEGMTELYVTLGVVVSGGGNLVSSNQLQLDGMLIGQSANKLGAAWADLAEKDPKVKKALTKLLSSGGWSMVIAAHAPLVLGIAGNHGVKIPGLNRRPNESVPSD